MTTSDEADALEWWDKTERDLKEIVQIEVSWPDVKALAVGIRRRDAVIERMRSLLVRAQEKMGVLVKQTGGVYAGGDGVQFLNADIDAALADPQEPRKETGK